MPSLGAAVPRRRYDPGEPTATVADEEVQLDSVDTSASRDLARRAASAAAEKKASDIRLLEVGDLLAITDFFVLCSAANPRQMDVIIEEVEHAASAAGYPATRREGELDSGWVVRDFGEVVVHVFTEEQRRVYDLERLWREAPAEDYTPAEAGPATRTA